MRGGHSGEREHEWCRGVLRACGRVGAMPLSLDDDATSDAEKKASAARDASRASEEGAQRKKQTIGSDADRSEQRKQSAAYTRMFPGPSNVDGRSSSIITVNIFLLFLFSTEKEDSLQFCLEHVQKKSLQFFLEHVKNRFYCCVCHVKLNLFLRSKVSSLVYV